MTKAEYRAWYREQRKGARIIAQEEFKKYPGAKTCFVPVIPPIDAINPERYAIFPRGNMQYDEGIYNEGGELIHFRRMESWQYPYIEVNR